MHGINGISGIMGLGWIIGLAALIVLIWVLIKFVGPGKNSPTKTNQSPLDILDERYAKGEIEKDEYLEKKKHLE